MRVPIACAFLITLVSNAYADGLKSLSLKEVLPRAEVIVIAEISSNDVKIIERNSNKGPASIIYSCSIKANVLEEIKGHAPKKLDIEFTFTVVQGVWEAWPGSGLEQHMKPNEKYMLLFELDNNALQLLRAEKVY